jgi:hypothetical protein
MQNYLENSERSIVWQSFGKCKRNDNVDVEMNNWTIEQLNN